MNYQDMLAHLGLGNAHPGGYSATLDLLKLIAIPEKSRILEIGCGTGRTACTLAKMGFDVTAIDIRPSMISKAKQRGELEGVQVNWVTGDVNQLPFTNESFDIVFVESVTVFVNSENALDEYYRVLKLGGNLYDREMMDIDLSPDLKDKICKFYEVKMVPSANLWMEMTRNTGFNDVNILNYISVAEDMENRIHEDVDPYQMTDPEVYLNPKFIEMSINNTELMFMTSDHLAHGVITGRKGG